MSPKPERAGRFFWEGVLDHALSEETEKHIAEQRQALARNPFDPQPCFHLGVLHQMQRNTEAAIEMFERALALDPRFDRAHQYLGQIYAALGDYARAWAHAQEAAALGNTVLLDMLKRYPGVTRPAD